MATQQWKVVQRRRTRQVPHSGGVHPPPRNTAPLVAYSHRPTYAQVLQGGRSLTESTIVHRRGGEQTTVTQQSLVPPHAYQPPNAAPHREQQTPPQPQQPQQPGGQEHALDYAPRYNRRQPQCRSPPKTIASPDSTATLWYPPSQAYLEWRQRCFCCFRKGHHSSDCKNPRRCASCWTQGHDFAECPVGRPLLRRGPTTRQASTRPTHTRNSPTPVEQNFCEPDFEDILDNSDTTLRIHCPDDNERPEKVTCFFPRDSLFVSEVERLSLGLVVTLPPDYEIDLPLDDIADYVASSGLVTSNQLSVGAMSNGRYLVLPPSSVSTLSIAHAIP